MFMDASIAFARHGSNARGVVRRIAIAVLALFQFATLHGSEAYAQAVLEEFPFLVDCEVGGVHHVYYLSKVGADGVAVYSTTAGQSVTLTLTGKAEKVGGDVASSCAGKTIEQLRSTGQAYYLQP